MPNCFHYDRFCQEVFGVFRGSGALPSTRMSEVASTKTVDTRNDILPAAGYLLVSLTSVFLADHFPVVLADSSEGIEFTSISKALERHEFSLKSC
jgi:hypothetical protein